ncbi:hypothetical protein F5883DRAFT_167070 [Diaporthe sp. PMI_573]|nr:hypothetical protein F5883DRAFT_167070 [Diaporthaceae sp. PMI_573]
MAMDLDRCKPRVYQVGTQRDWSGIYLSVVVYKCGYKAVKFLTSPRFTICPRLPITTTPGQIGVRKREVIMWIVHTLQTSQPVSIFFAVKPVQVDIRPVEADISCLQRNASLLHLTGELVDPGPDNLHLRALGMLVMVNGAKEGDGNVPTVGKDYGRVGILHRAVDVVRALHDMSHGWHRIRGHDATEFTARVGNRRRAAARSFSTRSPSRSGPAAPRPRACIRRWRPCLQTFRRCRGRCVSRGL